MRKEARFFELIVLFCAGVFLLGVVMADPTWQSGFPNTVFQATEDSFFSYNFSQNVTNPNNETLLFGIDAISVDPDLGLGNATSNYTWFSINENTGNLTLNSTKNNQTGYFTVTVSVKNASNLAGQASLFYFNVTAVNDRPLFVNLTNQSFNHSALFEYIIQVTDEESNTPFSFNISFISCAVSQWSTRDCSSAAGRELFNTSQYGTNGTSGQINISFTPQRNDVGSYIINFTVTDTNNNITPYNATTSQLVNFTVNNVNVAPYFRYVCDNERNTTEGATFSCYINATDIDEINNLTFRTNYTWFTFNNSGTNATTIATNSTTSFNASALVNFTTTDAQVGNWSINVSLTDTGSPSLTNSTVFWFFINNTDDALSLQNVSNISEATSNTNHVFHVNATDDDLLIPDKSVYNETITFTANNTNISVSSVQVSGTNKSQATLSFNPQLIGAGTHAINLTARDANNYSIDSKIFYIIISSNNAPNWTTGTQTNFSLVEDQNFYLNLSANVSDANNDSLTFSFSNSTSFPSFSVNSTTGIINFTPVDSDVGEQIVTINVTDGSTAVPLTFNFTINNTLDTPVIDEPIDAAGGDIINATGGSDVGINVSEDNRTTITFLIGDDDFKIPTNQKRFYNESISINLTVQGPNINLFSFTQGTPSVTNGNVQLTTIFTPNKSDVGSYNISINASDVGNRSDFISFNLTVFATNHPPFISAVGNQTTSVNRTVYIDFNATDIDEGNESGGNLTYSYAFLSGNDFINNNSAIFNRTNGILNITFNSSQGGKYHLNISVNDTSNVKNSTSFWINVYDAPTILFPMASSVFNLTENNARNLNFTANHSIGDTLNYSLYIAGVLRYNTTLTTNGINNLSWTFTPNYTDETYGLLGNLSLVIINPYFSDINATREFNLNISHTNSPVTFEGEINDREASYDNTIQINLSSYFSDDDYTDANHNQTVNFTVASNASSSALTISFNGWLMNIDADQAVSELLNITGRDYNSTNSSLTNATSNNFVVTFTTPTGSTTTTSGGGSGGSTTVDKLVSLHILVPEGVSAKKKDRIIVPISLINDGEKNLSEIILSAYVVRNGVIRDDLIASFDDSFIESLAAGSKKNTTLIIDIDTETGGLFEVNINATVRNPKYSDFAKFFISIEEDEAVKEKIIFTEEFVVGNPECAEIKELVEEARALFERGDITAAEKKADEALDACKRAIAQPISSRVYERLQENILVYVGVLTLAAIAAGAGYYYYKRRKLERLFYGR